MVALSAGSPRRRAPARCALTCRPGSRAVSRAARLVFAALSMLWCANAPAEWTGVSMTFGNYDSDWAFSGETREARISEIDFRIEERTQSGLAFGAIIGYMDTLI